MKHMTMKHRTGTFEEFKDYTVAVARGERRVDPREPKIWCEPVEAGADRAVRFASLEAGAKLLSAKNRTLLRAIAERKPQSVSELAALTGRAEQNVLRTLNKLAAAGVIRLDKGAGRARRPVLAARKVHFEIDLLGGESDINVVTPAKAGV
jgi:predicted transcriptional regulator